MTALPELDWGDTDTGEPAGLSSSAARRGGWRRAPTRSAIDPPPAVAPLPLVPQHTQRPANPQVLGEAHAATRTAVARAAGRAPGGEPAVSRQALVAAIVAWHNRHPLAKRITAARISGVGLASVPFSAWPQDDRAGARAFALVDEVELIAGLRSAAVVAFARDHGWPDNPAQPPFPGWRTRSVPVAAGWAAKQACAMAMPVATLGNGSGHTRRVLVGRVDVAGSELTVLGQRLWSRPRLAAAGAALMCTAALTVGAAMLALRQALPTRAPAAAPSAVVLDAPAWAPDSKPAPTTPSATPSARAPVTTAAVAPPPAMAQPTATALSPAAAAQARRPHRLVGYLGSDPDGLLQRMVQARDALASLGAAGTGIHVDMVQTEDGEGLVLWPAGNGAQAEQLRLALAARGLRLRAELAP